MTKKEKNNIRLTKKDFETRTEFDLWLEKCPLEPIDGKTWSFTEREYTNYIQITLRFRVPKQKKEIYCDN